MELVFVYGSLKRGQRNHHLIATARFEGEAQAPGLVLHDLGPFPMAIAAPEASAAAATGAATETETETENKNKNKNENQNKNKKKNKNENENETKKKNESEQTELNIHGEVFAVDGETLQRLDRLEGVPRLYQRHRRQLQDGRHAWLYLGRAHQVRHVPALPAGQWPALLLPLILLMALAPAALRAETSLADCHHWRSSHGESRIALGNQIGAASYLTKMHRLQQSPPEAPVALYAESDLERACDSAR